MKSIHKLFPLVALVAISFSNFSCDKSDLDKFSDYDVSIDEVESVMQTEAMLNVAFIDVFNIGVRAGAFADKSSVSSSGKKLVVPPIEEILGGEMSIRYLSGSIGDKVEIPITVFIDWGDVNKIGADGFARRGNILATLKNTNWVNEGSEITIMLTDYYFKDYKIEGEVTLKNLGSGLFETVVDECVITSPDGKVAKRNSNLFLNWKDGMETPMDIMDDVWNVHGNVEGITSTEMEYEISIEESNYLLMTSCEFPLKGIADFMIKKVKFALDYAPESEECDSKAELQFYGTKKIIDFGEEVN